MKNVRLITTALLLVGVVTTFGCKSKQEAPGAKNAASPQSAGSVKSISGQSAGGAIATSPQDKADAEAAAVRVFAQMEAGEFAPMYRDASAGFKKIGSEAAFVAKFQQTRQKTGPFANPRQTSFVTLPDQTHVLVFRAENQHFTTERRLTFARSKAGKMELFGLNQHDEAKRVSVK